MPTTSLIQVSNEDDMMASCLPGWGQLNSRMPDSVVRDETRELVVVIRRKAPKTRPRAPHTHTHTHTVSLTYSHARPSRHTQADCSQLSM